MCILVIIKKGTILLPKKSKRKLFSSPFMKCRLYYVENMTLDNVLNRLHLQGAPGIGKSVNNLTNFQFLSYYKSMLYQL